MSITFVAYDCEAQPTVDDILDYVGAILEFSGQTIEGKPIYAEIRKDFPEIGKTFYGTLFRINDVKHHSDDFYIMISKAFTELLEPTKSDKKTIVVTQEFITNETGHWLQSLKGEVVDNYYLESGKRVIRIKGDNTYLNDVFTSGMRRHFTIVKGEKKQ